MTPIASLVRRDWLLIRTLSVEIEDHVIWVFDCEEPADRDEPGHYQATQLAPDLAEQLADMLRLAATLARVRDDRQTALPLAA